MKKSFSERGSVLVLALLVTMLVLGIGLTVMWVATSGTKITGNLTRRQEALYAAEACIERAKTILASTTSFQDELLQDCCNTGDLADTKGRVLQSPNCGGSAFYNTGLYDGVAVKPTNWANVTYTSYIRNDPNEWEHCDGIPPPGETSESQDCDDTGGPETDAWRNTNDLDNRVIVRCEGRGRDGISVVAVEILVGAASEVSGMPCYTQEGGCGAQSDRSSEGSVEE
ncbi:MAG: pilus assembly PilX N-terminal domain-containing protein [Pseudomonadota bacterium]